MNSQFSRSYFHDNSLLYSRQRISLWRARRIFLNKFYFLCTEAYAREINLRSSVLWVFEKILSSKRSFYLRILANSDSPFSSKILEEFINKFKKKGMMLSSSCLLTSLKNKKLGESTSFCRFSCERNDN